MSHSRLNYLDALHSHGHRMTAQRKVVLDAVCAAGPHASLGQIMYLAKRSDASLSASTVYRALALFTELDLVLVAGLEQGEKRYEIAMTEPHHHLRCRNCGQVLTLNSELVGPFFDSIGHTYNFVVAMDHLILQGICENCSKKNTKAK